MDWAAELFYGLATALALGLSWKQGGPIAIAASLISAMWLFQGAIYWAGLTVAGNMMASMISGTLLLLISTLPRSGPLWTVMACLVTQLAMHVSIRSQDAYSDVSYIAINVLYLVQLIALGWSGGRIVLDELGNRVADFWARWGVVGLARPEKACSHIRFLLRATSRYYLGRIYVGSSRDLRGTRG